MNNKQDGYSHRTPWRQMVSKACANFIFCSDPPVPFQKIPRHKKPETSFYSVTLTCSLSRRYFASSSRPFTIIDIQEQMGICTHVHRQLASFRVSTELTFLCPIEQSHVQLCDCVCCMQIIKAHLPFLLWTCFNDANTHNKHLFLRNVAAFRPISLTTNPNTHPQTKTMVAHPVCPAYFGLNCHTKKARKSISLTMIRQWQHGYSTRTRLGTGRSPLWSIYDLASFCHSLPPRAFSQTAWTDQIICANSVSSSTIASKKNTAKTSQCYEQRVLLFLTAWGCLNPHMQKGDEIYCFLPCVPCFVSLPKYL